MAKQAASVKRSLSLGGAFSALRGPGVVRLDWILEGAAREDAERQAENEAYAVRQEAHHQKQLSQREWVIARVGPFPTTDEWAAAFNESDLIFFPYNPHNED